MRVILAAAVFFCEFAHALEPEVIFQRLSPSIWVVRAVDAQNKPFSLGSGVVIGPGKVVTNCHVLARAKGILVQREKLSLPATLEFPDAARDLCQLNVPELVAPAVQLATMKDLRVGQRVYAIGSPRGLQLSMSEGIISSLRDVDEVTPLIQTTAPISPGSSGGGLFDSEGRLIGITTLFIRDAQNLNFAYPADWILELPERGAAALRKYAERPAPSSVAAAPAIASHADEWAARIALLELNRGQLTFFKAVTILLDLKNAEELNTLVTYENQIKRKEWHNSYAMGVDNNGNITWGGGYRLRSTRFASETGIEQCAKSARDSCKVVMLDGDFREMDFVEMAKGLGARNIAAVRETYMQSLQKQPAESVVGGGGSHQAYMAQGMGYTSTRE